MTTVTLTSSELRHSKAILIAADSGQWLRPDRLIDGHRAVGIPSQTKRGLYHWTDGVTCSCYDFRRRQQACKHVTAFRLDAIARASEPQPQPASDTVDGLRQMLDERLAEHETVADSKALSREAHPELARILGKPLAQPKPVLEMVREDDGSISWVRPEERRLADRYADIFKRFDDETPEQIMGRL